MPNLLYIDTSAALATIAISADGRVKAISTHHNAHEQAAVLNTMIRDALDQCGFEMGSIDAINVCAGPGSYTGLRVGLSTAKGIAYAKDIPLLLFNRLDLIAWEQDQQKAVAVLLKARAGEYFLATYRAGGEAEKQSQHIFAQDLAAFAGQDLLFVTDDDTLSLTGNYKIIDTAHPVNLDKWILHAEQRFGLGQFDDLAYSEPFYLKAAYTTQSKK